MAVQQKVGFDKWEQSIGNAGTVGTLLDTAEALFAKRGFHGVSIRDITKAADASLSAINYHFGSKDNLMFAVITRRADVLSKSRLQLLSRAMADNSPDKDRLESIIWAFVQPLINKAASGDPGWLNYLRLVAMGATTHELFEKVITEKYNPTVIVFISAIQAELPHLDEEDVILGFLFLMATMLNVFAQTGRAETLTNGKIQSSDFQHICSRMIPFLTAGFRGMSPNN